MIKRFFLIVLIFLTLYTPAYAEEKALCDQRYLTLVNPVRGRDLWIDKSLKPLQDQYELVNKFRFSATWLLQYDVLGDSQLLAIVNSFNNEQEKGIFLEISKKLADDARVTYPVNTPWFAPQAVFLSGYEQTARKKLIDKAFQEFKKQFGYYPSSVGAWWIDSYSVQFMKEKYRITSVLIVADQLTTDNYGVWGQWWGVPYYPSKANILTPASDLANKQDVVVIQWAQRDPILAYGEGPKFSNYSLQANDYIRQGKDTKYFIDLVSAYLDCQNPMGQITVGLETGIESVGYLSEYENQLQVLSEIKGLKSVTMSNFYESFSNFFPKLQEKSKLEYMGSHWLMNTNYRSNRKLNDFVRYNQDVAFSDFFIADNKNFLNRNLSQLENKNSTFYFPYFLIVLAVLLLISLYKNHFELWAIGTLFSISAFGLILRSNYQLGFEVLYGASVPFLMYTQVALVFIGQILIWFLYKLKYFKKNQLILYFLPLIFGLDFIIQILRFSFISEKYYFGFIIDAFRFIGFSFNKQSGVQFINQDFPSYLAAGLLKLDFDKIWNSLWLSILVYPLAHLIFGVMLGILLIKLPNKLRTIILLIFLFLFIANLLKIFQADPRLVQ